MQKYKMKIINIYLFETNLLKFILYKIYMSFLILFIYEENVKTIGYQFEQMDLEICLGQFDIHRDTIIRTGESQAIGGKYIQGIGLNNLNECQRLCCETEHCDVYIFEEKAEGYCYLFECGPPENFHCKFTRHANYTSAVLTPTKHATSPPPTLKTFIIPHPPQSSLSQNSPVASSLSQHELELTNLKQQSDTGGIGVQQNKVLPTTKIPPFGAGDVGADIRLAAGDIRSSEQITTPKSNSHINASLCGRFQFQCHSGECIAVYNACDGIPQCEDGSDEGPECPSTIGTDTKLINTEANKLADITNYKIPSGNVAVSLSKQTMQNLPRQYLQQSPVQVPMINNREDPMSTSTLWQNRKGQETQNDMEKNSHIFNHKGGLQLPANNISPQYQNPSSNIYNPIQRNMYMQTDMQNGFRNSLLQPQDHIIIPPNMNWQQSQIQQQQSLIPPGPYVIAVNGQPVPQIKSVPISSSQTLINSAQMKTEFNRDQNPLKEHSESSNNGKIIKNQKDHKEKESAEQSEDYSYYEEKSTEPPKKKQRKHKKTFSKDENKKENEKDEKKHKNMETPIHERYKMIKENLEMEFVDHDGQSERPGGAVLSLTLGIIVTAALAILIGCRMRTVGRRIRRIGKMPYAHDADFLVNGMYL